MGTASTISTSLTTLTGALDIPLDVFGQSASLQIYTHNHSMLEKGLERLCESFPWVAGQVIKSFGKSAPLVVKDLSNGSSIPTMDALRKANFPMRLLDERIIAPRRTLPGHPDEAGLNSPVLLLQATFVNGGLLLTFASQHATMDMTRQGQLMNLVNRACHDEPFTDEELRIGNIDRQNLVPLLDNYQPGPEISHLIIKPLSAKRDLPDLPHTQKLPAPSSWSHFSFSESLAALNSLAETTKSSSMPYVSTDDALSALIWQAVARALLPRLTPSTTSTFGRALDARPYMYNIPSTYPGLMQSMCFNKATLKSLATSKLGAVASNLRQTLHPSVSRTKHIIRATATPQSIQTVSSWCKVNACSLDFNLGLGKPEAVRRPHFRPVEGVGVAVYLRDEDSERMKADSEFGRFVGLGVDLG
ncbi:hypothetical protein BDW69DRAFT_198578 [Aspergillus filifer]